MKGGKEKGGAGRTGVRAWGKVVGDCDPQLEPAAGWEQLLDLFFFFFFFLNKLSKKI